MWGINFLLVLSLAVYANVEGRSAPGGLQQYCPNPNGIYPVASENCNTYIECQGGRPYHKTCSSGQAYNTVKRSCDLQENVRCNAAIEVPTPPLRGPCDSGDNGRCTSAVEIPARSAPGPCDLGGNVHCSSFIEAPSHPVPSPCGSGNNGRCSTSIEIPSRPTRGPCGSGGNVHCNNVIEAPTHPIQGPCGSGHNVGCNTGIEAPTLPVRGSCGSGYSAYCNTAVEISTRPARGPCGSGGNGHCNYVIEAPTHPVQGPCGSGYNVGCNTAIEAPTHAVHVPAARQTVCPRQNGAFPVSSNDCSKYMVCHEGEPTYMDCPRGLAYDTNKQSCDWSQNVACPSARAPVRAPASPPAPAARAPIDFSCQQSNGYQQISGDCNSYIECQDNQAYKTTCPGGLQFNPEAQYPEYACDYSQKVQCTAGQSAKQYPTSNWW